MKIGVVMPTINLWKEYTLPAIKSLKSEHELLIYVVDNASLEGVAKGYRELKDDRVKLKRFDTRQPLSKCWNWGIEECFAKGCDFVYVVNNDVLFHPEAIDQAVKRLQDGLKAGDPNPITLVSSNDVRTNRPEEILTIAINPNSLEDEHPCFSAFMISPQCWNTVGRFDEVFNPAYFEDNDYHYRIIQAGMKAIKFPGSLFYHYASRTQLEAEKHRVVSHQAFRDNAQRYINKWGGLPGQEKFTSPYNK